MKRVAIAMVVFITLLAVTAPLALADESPPTGTGPGTGGCSGPDCKYRYTFESNKLQ